MVKEQIEDPVAGKATKDTSQNTLPPVPSGGTAATPPPVVVNQTMSERQFNELTTNVSTLRQELLSSLGMDKRRNINADCGYPDNPSTENFFRLYQRNPYARRACEVFPREAFKSRLTVRETRDPCGENDEEDTEFDKAVDELSSSIRGVKSWFKDKDGSVVHEIMMRAAIQAGIGQYSVILLGLNDGLPLDQPVAGVEEQWSMPSERDEDGKPKAKSERADPEELPKPRGVYNLRTTEKINQCFVVNEEGKVSQTEGERKLIFLRAFGELSAPVTSWELNRTSPRFNQPVYYQITFNSPWDSGQNLGQPMTTQNVHWTRVVHIPGRDIQGGTELTSTSELEPIVNSCLNLDKIIGASGEGYWKSCFTALSIETHPTLGTSVKVDKANIRSQLENFDNSLTRTLFLMGVQAKTIAPSVTDPTPHIASNVEAICIQKGIPKRKFMGSERGELASSQDEGDWNDQIRIYHRTYATPRVVVPLYDRFIMVGVLPEPESYGVEWEDLSSLTAMEKAQVAVQMTTALGQAVATGVVPTFFSEEDYLVVVCGYDRTLAQEVLSNAEDAQLEKQAEMDQMGIPSAPGMPGVPAPPPPPGFEDGGGLDEDGNGIPDDEEIPPPFDQEGE